VRLSKTRPILRLPMNGVLFTQRQNGVAWPNKMRPTLRLPMNGVFVTQRQNGVAQPSDAYLHCGNVLKGATAAQCTSSATTTVIRDPPRKQLPGTNAVQRPEIHGRSLNSVCVAYLAMVSLRTLLRVQRGSGVLLLAAGPRGSEQQCLRVTTSADATNMA
jgi:hypothetical protein